MRTQIPVRPGSGANGLASHPNQACSAFDPNHLARQLTGRDYISYSAITTYQKCPLSYCFQYIMDLPFERVPASLVFGGAIHAAVEAHFQAMLAGEPRPALEELLTVYDSAWHADTTAPIQFGKGENETSLRDLARRMLAAFQGSPVSRLDCTILGVEEELRAPVIPACPDLLGRIDLVLTDGDHLRLVDFKTSRSKWNGTQVTEHAPQMLLYAELARPLAEAYGDLPVQLEWIVLTKTQSPTIETHVLTPDPRQLSRTKTVVQRVWASIQAGHF